MKLKKLSWFVLLFFALSVFAPSACLPLAAAAEGGADTVGKVASELSRVYESFDDGDRMALRDARGKLKTLSDGGWDSVIGEVNGTGDKRFLLTEQVVNKFGENDDSNGAAKAAKDALIGFISGLAEIYYSDTHEGLVNTLNEYKENNKANFATLFGNGITIDALYDLLVATQEALPDVISEDGITIIAELARGNKDTLNKIFKDAVIKALAEGSFDNFQGKLSDIGWSIDLIIAQGEVLAGQIDEDNKARLALAKAAVRSETELAEGKISLNAGESTTYRIEVMGLDATSLVDWESSNLDVAAFDDDKNTSKLTAKKVGKTTVTAFRKGTRDWIIKFNVTVSQPSSGGGGGGGTTPPPGVQVTPTSGGTVEMHGVKVAILALTFDETVNVNVTKVTDIKALPLFENLLGDVFEITLSKDVDFNKPVTITLPFDIDKVDPEKHTVGLFWYNEDAKKWISLDDVSVDLEKGLVSGSIDHFTKFAVLAIDLDAEEEEIVLELKDIKGHWAEKAIKDLLITGAVKGYPDQTFKPDNNITRAEFATIIVNAYDLSETVGKGKIFADTDGHWAESFVSIAASNGILSGYSDTAFGPDDNITREQMAVMIANAAKLADAAESSKFADSADIATWAAKSVNNAVEAGIIKGYPDNTFKPQDNATRAEAVTVIVNALD